MVFWLVTALSSARVAGVLSDGSIVLEEAGVYQLVAADSNTPRRAADGWAPLAILPMSAGAVSPSPGHAIVIERAPAGPVTVDRLDARGRTPVATLDASCPEGLGEPRGVSSTVTLSVHWADGALTASKTRAVVTGYLPDCGPTVRPVLLVVDFSDPMTPAQRLGAAQELTARLASGALDPFVAEVAVGLAPDLPDPLLALAEARAAAGDAGGAVAALWALSASTVPDAPERLRAALLTEWVAPLRQRAAFRTLEWTVGQSAPQ